MVVIATQGIISKRRKEKEKEMFSYSKLDPAEQSCRIRKWDICISNRI